MPREMRLTAVHNLTELYNMRRTRLTPEVEEWLHAAARSADKSVSAMSNLCLGLVYYDRGDRCDSPFPFWRFR